jgi:hypothetical protein
MEIKLTYDTNKKEYTVYMDDTVTCKDPAIEEALQYFLALVTDIEPARHLSDKVYDNVSQKY